MDVCFNGCKLIGVVFLGVMFDNVDLFDMDLMKVNLNKVSLKNICLDWVWMYDLLIIYFDLFGVMGIGVDLEKFWVIEFIVDGCWLENS